MFLQIGFPYCYMSICFTLMEAYLFTILDFKK